MTRRPPPPDPAIPLDVWAGRGIEHRIFGSEIFTAPAEPKPDGGETIRVLHGFPASSLGFRAPLPRLAPIAGYMNERVRFRERWIGALTRLDLPTHILWGRRDPVALPAVASALAAEIPGARLTWLDELGHYPMLESPDRWALAVLTFLDKIPG
jgi:hypothetical protein